MTMLLRHLQIKGLNLMLAKLKDCFINQFRVSSRLTGLDLIPKNLQSHCTRNVSANFGQQINMLSKVCTCTEITFLGELKDFILIISIYLSTVSFETGNSSGWGKGEGGKAEVGSLCYPPFPNLLFLPSWLYSQFS